MKIKAIIFMSDDMARLDFTLKHFKRTNPHIPVLVYDNGKNDASSIAYKYGYEYKKIESIWHKQTHCGAGSFSFHWFELMFAYGLADDEYTHILFLETDVYALRTITREPQYEMAGPLMHANPVELAQWGLSTHTGCGGTIYAKSFFKKCEAQLPVIKKDYEDHIENCYMDLLMTRLGTISGCTIGPWEEADHIASVNFKVALMHNVKYESPLQMCMLLAKARIKSLIKK
jgi:hypothetical protein